jgi:uncharacterized protein (TIGR02145 family)
MKNPFSISGVILLIILIYSCKKEIEYSIKDIDGNDYNTVMIGTQVWIKENLKTTKYNDGETIPLILDGAAWKNLFTEGCCWYENNIVDSKEIYGLLYNWHTVNTGKLCPKGWHVPTDDEWHTMIMYLDASASLTVYESTTAGDKLKEVGSTNWPSPNTGATNESGFTALPGGYRYNNGEFYGFGNFAIWWSSTEDPANDGNALNRALTDLESSVGRSFGCKNDAYSVRCLKNN